MASTVQSATIYMLLVLNKLAMLPFERIGLPHLVTKIKVIYSLKMIFAKNT